MKKHKIAYDVDNTLIIKNEDGRDIPNYGVIDMLVTLHDYFDVYVWSGSGIDYAQTWVDKLGLTKLVTVIKKEKNPEIDMCFDDMEGVDLAKINVQV